MSSTMQAKKRQEALENMKHADKYLAKTMLRWHPDYLAAAPYLEKAADAFRAAGDYDQAKKTFVQAAAVQQKNKSSFRAAQNCENAAKVVVQQIKENRPDQYQKLQYLQEVRKHYEKASSYFGDMGELGKAADALVKGAGVCEENGMDDVKDIYLQACSLMETQGKPHFAVDVFRKTQTYLLKQQQYQEAIELLHRLTDIFKQIDQRANVHKCYLSEVILWLTLTDVAAAEKAYMKHMQDDDYLKADECALAEDLVRAYKTSSEDLLQQTVKKQGISFLDNQVGRLARKLTLFGGGGVAPVAPPAAPVAAKNPFAPSARAAPAAPAPAPAPMEEYEFATATATAASAVVSEAALVASMAEVSVSESTQNTRSSDFDYDALEFSMGGEADAPAANTAPSSAAPPLQQPPVADDMFDLT